MRLTPILPPALLAVAAAVVFPITQSAGEAKPKAPVALPAAVQAQPSPAAVQARTTPRPRAARAPARTRPAIRWRRSVAVGAPTAGSLVRGVRLPASGDGFITWDPNLHRSPNRAWRRWCTDRLARKLLAVARAFHAAHPNAGPLLIGDLSRPHGGDFGRQYGYVWHASHQNGLDADVYYPRADKVPRAARTAADIDRRLSQDLVDRFVRAGATVAFVGPGTGLTGPPGVVQVIPDHDDHVHVRFAP
jgi:murein endopeptidase